MTVHTTEEFKSVVFKSKIDRWLIAVVGAGAGISFAAFVALLFSHRPIDALIALPAFCIGCGLPIWVFRTTAYEIEGDRLIVRSGPMKWTIRLGEITRITPTTNPLSSPALSLDRLKIEYGPKSWVMISPRDRVEFLRILNERSVLAAGSVSAGVSQ